MKTITLKADDKFDKTLTSIAKRTKTTKSGVIREAVLNYKKHLEREALRARLKEASLRTRHQAKQIAKELDAANFDGL